MVEQEAITGAQTVDACFLRFKLKQTNVLMLVLHLLQSSNSLTLKKMN